MHPATNLDKLHLKLAIAAAHVQPYSCVHLELLKPGRLVPINIDSIGHAFLYHL